MAWFGLFGGGGPKFTPSQRAEFDGLLTGARPENKKALEMVAADIAASDGDKAVSAGEMGVILGVASHFAKSTFDETPRIEKMGATNAELMRNHAEALQTLARMPSLVDDATAKEAKTYYPAITKLAGAVNTLQMSLLDPTQKQSIKAELARLLGRFEGLASVELPAPMEVRYLQSPSVNGASLDQLTRSMAGALQHSLLALLQRAPTALGLKPRWSSVTVDVEKTSHVDFRRTPVSPFFGQVGPSVDDRINGYAAVVRFS